MNANTLPQTACVASLIKAAAAALPHLPAPEKLALEAALETFESVVVVTAWNVGDVDMDGDLGLDLDERRSVLTRMLNNYETTESDWELIHSLARSQLSLRLDETA